jgi:LysM repeat protein
MLCKHPLLALTSGLVFALGTVSCVGNKNKDVAETPVAAPPAAAYPDSSTDYPNSSGNSSSSSANDYAATNSSSAPQSAPSAPSASVFDLRAGEQLIDHTIKRGDTLGGLATHYNSSQSRIMAANGMTSTKIYAGKNIKIPTSAPPPGLAMNGAGAGAAPSTTARTGSYPSSAPASPYSRLGSYSAPSSSPYSPPVPVAPAPVAPSTSYGSGSYGSSTTGGSYPSPTSAPAPAPVQPGYSTGAPSPPVSPSTTSFPRVQTAPVPPQAGGSFPTPNLSSGSGQVQFSN